MSAIEPSPALEWYAICVVVLFLKMFALSSYQAVHRIGRRVFTNPEDAKYFGTDVAPEELEPVRRAARAWANDIENIPAFFALGVTYVLLGASPGAAAPLFVTFTVARILHSLVYLAGLQPWRTVAYSLGVASLFGMSIAIVAALA